MDVKPGYWYKCDGRIGLAGNVSHGIVDFHYIGKDGATAPVPEDQDWRPSEDGETLPPIYGTGRYREEDGELWSGTCSKALEWPTLAEIAAAVDPPKGPDLSDPASVARFNEAGYF